MRFLVSVSGIVVVCILLACGDGFTSGQGEGGATTTGSTTGQGGGGNWLGCSDGTRELFSDTAAEPAIAGCLGGFQIPGVTTSESKQPQCGRAAGNDSGHPLGDTCSVADLCAVGWHVCDTIQDVSDSMQGDICPATADPSFWITRISTTPGTLECLDGGNDNLVGCGHQVGASPVSSCGPLNTVLLFSTCAADLGAWDCGGADDIEAQVVTKDKTDEGGVLCCKG